MPAPLARCAFSRSSAGTSTVILRAVSMTPHNTIRDTSIEYGLPRCRLLLARMCEVLQCAKFTTMGNLPVWGTIQAQGLLALWLAAGGNGAGTGMGDIFRTA